jgi:hypothetical protein
MEGLAVAIQQRAISFPDGLLVSELEAFEYSYTRTGVLYSAPEGLTDDGVCALALAVRRWRGAGPPAADVGLDPEPTAALSRPPLFARGGAGLGLRRR